MSPEQIAKVHRVLRAPPEVVFDEWLDPVGMTEWMCPRPARAVKIALDPVPGGVLRIDVSDSGMLFYVTGQFVELDRPRLLRFTWSCSDWADPTVQSLVTVGLEPRGAAETLMTITHELLPAEQAHRHSTGWTAIAGQFAQTLTARFPDLAFDAPAPGGLFRWRA